MNGTWDKVQAQGKAVDSCMLNTLRDLWKLISQKIPCLKIDNSLCYNKFYL